MASAQGHHADRISVSTLPPFTRHAPTRLEARALRARVTASRRYLYCGSGFRSAPAADNLRKMGYKRPISVDGGWRVLKDIMPVE